MLHDADPARPMCAEGLPRSVAVVKAVQRCYAAKDAYDRAVVEGGDYGSLRSKQKE